MNAHKAKLPLGLRVLTLICLAVSVAGPQPAAGAENASSAGPVRVSVDSTGEQANGFSITASISADGRFVAFTSVATNLVAGDTNGKWDIFVHDCETGTTERVSVDSSGGEANGNSTSSSISADGRYVTFSSEATNLVTGDLNGATDTFVHDRQSGNTTLVSVNSNGSLGNNYSYTSSISGDGRYVAFLSGASNLVEGDTNSYMDVFVHDLQTGGTTRVSVDSNGLEANGASDYPEISADGRYVVFNSYASNLVTGETMDYLQTYVHDRQTGATSLVSVSSDGTIGFSPSYAPSISADGRYAGFSSRVSNLIQGVANGNGGIFFHNLKTGATALVYSNEQTGEAWFPSISGDGRSVAFAYYTNGTSDIFFHDRTTGGTTLLSANSSGDSRDGASSYPSMASNGLSVAFQSDASNLVPGDTNGTSDIFVSSWAPLPSFNLAVTWTGNGSGNVTSSPDGIDCSFACSSPFPQGIAVSLTAAANMGSYFTGWSGAATGTANPIDVTLDSDKSVSADFALYEYTLAVRSDHGMVTCSPDQASYHYGDVVELTAAPDPGYSFAYWSGDAAGSRNPIQVTIRGDTAVSANYIQGGRTLMVSSDHGTVTRSPDQSAYQDGGVVQLTASANAGWVFDHWSGAVSGTSNPVDVTINGDTSVTANYRLAEYDLKIVSEHGTVTRVPDQATYHYGDVVQLSAAANPLYLFSNWSGDAASTINPLDITIQGDTHLTANYSVNTDKRYVAPGGDDGASCLIPSEPCGTINAAIAKASSGDTVYVASGAYTGEDANEVVTIDKDLILSGGWNSGFTDQTGMSVIDGQGARRGVNIGAATGITVLLEKFILQNGFDSYVGGGLNNSGGIVTINRSLIQNNTAWWGGGGIRSSGTLALNESIVRDNAAGEPNYAEGAYGSGILNNSGSMTINNSTVSGNPNADSASGPIILNYAKLYLNNSTVSGYTSSWTGITNDGGTIDLNSSTVVNNEGWGIANGFGAVHLRNSILANNGTDCLNNNSFDGSVTSLGYNLIETQLGCTLDNSDLTNIDPKLGPLQDNGGSILTYALLPGSPAINAGNPAGCQGSAGLLTTDQRGFPRSDRCDIGAFEVKSFELSNMTVNPDYATAGSLVTYTITLTNGHTTGIDNVLVTDTLPDSLTYLDGSLTTTGGNADYASGTITWTGPVKSGGTQTITFGAMIKQAARGSVITNEALIDSGEEIFPRRAAVRVPPPFLNFLPMTIQPAPGFYGHVSLNGVAVEGVSLELRYYDGSTWSTLQTTSTELDGDYSFTGFPSLNTGQAYDVRFVNPATTADGRLSAWFTPVINNYGADRIVYLDDFDIADVGLDTPNPGAKVALPYTFYWTMRAATPGDSYQFELFDPDYGSVDFLSPLLGHKNKYVLNHLPPGVDKKRYDFYGWRVRVNSSNGGYGISFYYNPIAFK